MAIAIAVASAVIAGLSAVIAGLSWAVARQQLRQARLANAMPGDC
jgi:hypothetical protein